MIHHPIGLVVSSAVGVLMTIALLYCALIAITMYLHERPFLNKILLDYFVFRKLLGVSIAINFILQIHFRIIPPHSIHDWFILSVLPALVGCFSEKRTPDK